MKAFLSAIGALGILLITAVVAGVIAVTCAIGGNGGADNIGTAGFGGGITPSAPVPAWVEQLIEGAMAQYGCAETTPSLIAAQLYTESGFNPNAESKDSNGNPIAEGIAQFTPATWAAHGVDGNGDGIKDVWNPADAVPAAIAYDCYLANIVSKVPGDATDNMLAAYNAGPGAVEKAGGIPPITETRNYVTNIRALAQQWAADGGSGDPLPTGSGGAATAIAAAKTALGTPYDYGGPCVAPFTGSNGCDCSSLVQMAWKAAGVNLPRTTFEQVDSGTPVASVSDLAPGDLLFVPGSDGTASQPGHVGMYIGNNEVIQAPHTGEEVDITPLSQWTGSAGPENTIVAMRHIG